MTDPSVRTDDLQAPGRERSRSWERTGDRCTGHAPGVEPRSELHFETRMGLRDESKSRGTNRRSGCEGDGSPADGGPGMRRLLASPSVFDLTSSCGRADSTDTALARRLSGPTAPIEGESEWVAGGLDEEPASTPESVRPGPRTMRFALGLGGAYLVIISSLSCPLVSTSSHTVARWWRVAAEHPLRTSTALTLLAIAVVRRGSNRGARRIRRECPELESVDAVRVPGVPGTRSWSFPSGAPSTGAPSFGAPPSGATLAVAGPDPRPQS